MFSVPRHLVISLAALAATLAVGSLAGCAPAVSSGNPSRASSAAASGGSKSAPGQASCDEFTAKSFGALLNVHVGKPYVAGSDSAGGIICWYGIGKNAGVTGSRVETLEDDNILITTIGIDGASQYKHFTGGDVNVGEVTPISGIGDKAAYNVSELSGEQPELYAYKGALYCGVQLNADPSELVSSSAATTAEREGALCDDAFAKRS